MDSKPHTLQVGLTGNIGSGKSTVARLFMRKGAAVIDADALAKEATQDPEVVRQIAAVLGAEVLREGALDRAAVAARVFGDPGARAKLNAIVHPWVQRQREVRVAALLAQTRPPLLIVHDVPLLFETGLETAFDVVVVVDAPLELRLARVAARSGLSDAEVRARDATQMPLKNKVKRADAVLENSGDPDRLSGQVDTLWAELTSFQP